MACCNSIVVDAPREAVWKILRNFHDLSWATGVVESCEPVGDLGPTTPGAKRILNGVFHETLVGLDDAECSVSYTIDDGAGTPVASDKVSGYVGQIQAFPLTSTGGTFVLWTSRWQDSQGGVKDFCDPIYQAILASLQARFA